MPSAQKIVAGGCFFHAYRKNIVNFSCNKGKIRVFFKKSRIFSVKNQNKKESPA